MKTEPNEPANPAIVGKDGIYPQVGSESWQLPGLTKREYYAGLAMQGMLCYVNTSMPPQTIAEEAIRLADALITQLNKPLNDK